MNRSNLLRSVQDVEQSLHQRVFQSGMNPIFARASFTGIYEGADDAIGRQAYLGATLAQSEIHGLSVESVGGKLRKYGSGEIEAGFSRFLKASAGDTFTVAWDAELFAGMTRKATAGMPGVQPLAPVVSAKRLLNRFFGDVRSMADSSSAEDIERFVRSADPDKIATGSSMDYLTRARRAVLEEQYEKLSSIAGEAIGPINYGAELSPTQTAKMVYYASAMRAVEAEAGAPLGLDFFKQTLAQHGVPNISGTSTGMFSATDPYALAPAISRGQYAAYATSQGNVPGSMTFDDFFKRVELVAGTEYRQEFENVATKLYKQSGGKLALRMDEAGGVYMGAVGGDLSTFKPVPIGFSGKMGRPGASRAGMTSGMYLFGGKLQYARPIIGKEGVQSAAIAGLKAFYEGTQQILGTTPQNFVTALQAGYKHIKRANLVDGGVSGSTLGEVSSSLISHGQRSLYTSLYEQMTFRTGGNILEAVDIALGEVFKGVASGGISSMQGYNQAVRTALEQLPEHVKDSVTGKLLAVSRTAWPTLKHDIRVGNILPSQLLESDMFLPGELLTERAQSKGMYQVRGIKEIVRPEVIQRMARSNRRIGIGRASAIGMTLGDYRITKAMRKAYATGSVWSAAQGTGAMAPMTHALNVTAVVPGMTKHGDLRRFGDAGALLTPRGVTGLGYDMFATKQIKAHLNVDETVSHLRLLAGKYAGTTPWKDYIERVRSQGVRPGFMSAGQGLNIDFESARKGGIKVSPGTTHFLGMQLGDYNSERVFSFGRKANRTHMSGLLGGTSRVTATTGMSSTWAMEQYGDLAKVAHMITGKETFSTVDNFRVAFQHRTGLLATAKGADRLEDFMAGYRKAGGKGLIMRDGQLVATGAMERHNFLNASGRALIGMGFSPQEIAGHASAMVRLLGRIGGELGNMPESVARKSRIFLSTWSERAGAAEDIVAQDRAFGIRLQTLNQMAQSTDSKNPIYKLMKTTFEHETGVKISDVDTSPAGFIVKDSLPDAIKAPFMPLVDNSGLNSWAATRGMRVVGAEEVGKLFGSEISQHALKDGMLYEDVMNSKLMAPGRKGFYLNLGADQALAPVNAKGDTIRTSHVYIPGADELKRGVKGAPGELLKLGEESMEAAVFRLVSAAGAGKSGDIREAAMSLLQKQFSIGQKDGFLAKHGLYARAEVAAKGRILPHIGGAKESIASKVVNERGVRRVASDVYEVGMSTSTMKQMFTSASGIFDKQGYGLAVKAMEERGFIYGSLMPTPTHGAGHVNLVKFVLDKGQANNGQLGFRMSDFLASIMERDFDKDQIDAMLFSGKHWKTVTDSEYGSAEAAQDALDEAFKKQRLNHTRQMLSYEAGKAEWNGLFEGQGMINLSTQEGMEQFYKRAGALLGFGNLPPIPWIPYYSNLAFTGKLVAKESAENIAMSLVKEAGTGLAKDISATDVSAFRNAMAMRGMDANRVWGEAVLAYQSVAQSAIAKGGKFADDLVQYLGVQPEVEAAVRSGSMTMEQAISRQTAAAQEFFTKLLGDENLGKLRVHSAAYEGLSNQETARLAGEFLGRSTGVYAYAKGMHMQEGRSFRDVIKYGTSHPAYEGGYSLRDTIKLLTGFDIGQRIQRAGKSIVPTAQEGAEAMNASALSQGLKFLGEHWRGVGVGLGALFAAKGLYSAFGAGDMDAPAARMPTMGPAPLPPEPMTQRPEPGPNIPNHQYTAKLSPVNGMSSFRGGSDTRSAVNIKEMQVAVNAGAYGSNFTHARVHDSRSYSSNWELHDTAARYDRSDFLHEYMA